jgi:starch synthase
VIHTVSPSYAEEITKPSENNKYRRYYGGEGLDSYLLEAKDYGRLFGILNGCGYPETVLESDLEFSELLNVLRANVFRWAGTEDNLSASHFIAHTRLTELGRQQKKPDVILTSVTRAVGQKVRLLREITKSSKAAGKPKSALQSILAGIKDQGVYILLGTGEKEYEDFLTQMSSRHENFIFLCGYSDECSSALYQNGDLFIMPSLYEPCGISQMIAMRAGQPCIVHNVGGLKDTVTDGKNGFVFEGADLNLEEQADNFVQSCIYAVNLKQTQPRKFKEISENARKARFLWKDTVKQYIEKLYGQPA